MEGVYNLTPVDIPALKRFIRRQFHPRYVLLNDSFFRWQYRANPANSSRDYTMKILRYKGEVLGYGGVVPTVMKVDDHKLVAGVFANLLVDPKVRTFGLGTLLIKKISQTCPLCYVSGYSAALRAACLKIPGWREMGHLRRLVGVLNEKKLQILAETGTPFDRVTTPSHSDNHLTSVSSFGEEISSLWQVTRDRYGITAVRSPAYLNWRYTNHPLFDYDLYEYVAGREVLGYVVVRIDRFSYRDQRFSFARIIDLNCQERIDFDLASALTTVLQRKRVDAIDFFFSGTVYLPTFRRLGYVEATQPPYDAIPWLLNPVDRRRRSINWMVYDRGSAADQRLFSNQDTWYLTKGDGDQDRPNFPPPPDYEKS